MNFKVSKYDLSRGRQENGVVSFNSKDNANTFCGFFPNLTDSMVQKLPRPKNHFGIKFTGEYYKKIWNEC